MLGTAVERLAITVRHWQRTEVGEAEEAFGKGQKGSSAMPHKKNPILSREPVRPRAPAARRTRAPALEDVALWHERDISHSSVERVIGARRDRPRRLHGPRAPPALVDGLVVQRRAHAREPRAHAAGSIFSEAVMLALVRKGMARQAAYELVQRNALRAVAGEGDASATLLARRPDVAARLDAAELDARLQSRTPPAPRRRDHRPRPRDEESTMSRPIDEAVIRAQLDKTLGGTNFPELGEKYEGKVRDCYIARRTRARSSSTDRISAFDVVLGTIPFKGQVLNQMAAFWFEATADHRAQPRHQRARSRR